MPYRPIEETDMFLRMQSLSDRVWDMVAGWDPFAKETLGRRLVRAIDSVCLNLAEGDGRYSDAEALQFCYIARGSLREATYCIATAKRRNIVSSAFAAELIGEADSVRKMMNGIIAYRRTTKNMVREELAPYGLAVAPQDDVPSSRPTLHATRQEFGRASNDHED